MTTNTARQDAVLDGIREGKMLRDIGRDLNLSKQWVSQIVGQLIDKGLVVQPRRALYLTTDEPHPYRPAAHPAIRFTGQHSADRILELWGFAVRPIVDPESQATTMLKVRSSRTEKDAHLGDWIVVTGREPTVLDVVKPDVFAEQFEVVIDDGRQA